MTIEGQPQSRTDKIKRITRRALINRGINTVIGIGVGFATGRYAFLHDNPTIYNPQISLEGQDQEPISLTLQELAEAAQRVDDLGRVINEFVIEPDIGFNSSSVWSQDKAHIARLLGSVGLGNPKASWQFHDKVKILFGLEVDNTYVDNTYKDDNRLVQSIVRAKFNLPLLATRGLLDVAGLELPERVEIVEHPTSSLPFARAILIEGGGRIPPDPEKLRRVADRFVKLPDYVKWESLQQEVEGDSQSKSRWALKAAGKSDERFIEFTIWDTMEYRLKVIEQTYVYERIRSLYGSYIDFDEQSGVYFVTPYPVIQEGQLQLFEPLEKVGRGARISRDLKERGDRSSVEWLRPPVRIQAQYIAEVFGDALASDTGPDTEIFRNQIHLKEGRNKHFGGIHYVLIDKYGRFVDLQGNLLPHNERPYYLSKSEFQFTPFTQ